MRSWHAASVRSGSAARVGARRAVADFLKYPGVAVRVGEVGEAGVVPSLRVGTRFPAPLPFVDRRLVPDAADLDAASAEFTAGGFDVGDSQESCAERPRGGVSEPGADLDRARGAGGCQLDDAEAASGVIVDIEGEAGLLRVERQSLVDVAHRHGDDL